MFCLSLLRRRKIRRGQNIQLSKIRRVPFLEENKSVIGPHLYNKDKKQGFANLYLILGLDEEN